ncbi:MAG: PH domain-containing protein [Candidatus Nanopelagicales bacterium]
MSDFVPSDDSGAPAGPTAPLDRPQRTAPLTPLLQGAPAIPFFVIFAIGPAGSLVGDRGLPVVVVGVLGALLGYVIATAFAWITWLKRTYYFDAEGDLRVDSGVLQRSSRRLQLSRLQSVDVVAPFLPRLAGLVEVRVEVAGAGDSRVVLRYVTVAEGDRVRREILAKSTEATGPQQEESPPNFLAGVPSGRLLAGLLLRSVTVVLLASSVFFIAITVLTQGPVGLVFAVATGGLPILIVVGEFFRYHGFTVARSVEGLRLTFGLLSTQRRTVPADRVHAVALVAPLLWRRRDWVRVQLTIAGLGTESAKAGRDVLLPIAPRDEALRVVAEVLPGVDLDALPWVSAPARSRWRSPIQWRFLAYAVTGQVVAARTGRITRRIQVAPHARVQSVRVSQGPWERRLDLASVHADLAPGPVEVIAHHIDLAAARPLADHEADLARDARVRDHPT